MRKFKTVKTTKEELKYTKGFLNSVMKKLGNERFVNNAPPVVIEKENVKKADAEAKILKLTREEAHKTFSEETNDDLLQEDLFKARDEVLDIHMSAQLQDYIIQLIINTRNTEFDSDLKRWLDYGASPRATIALDRCARANAWLANRDYVTPEDIQSMAYDILRHRLILTYEAEAEGVDTDKVIERLIQITPVA